MCVEGWVSLRASSKSPRVTERTRTEVVVVAVAAPAEEEDEEAEPMAAVPSPLA